MLTLCAVVAVSLAAPVPKAAPVELYMPTTVGTKWVYEDQNGELVLSVTAVVDKDGAKIVTVSRHTGGQTKQPRETVIVSEKGIFRASVIEFKLDPPVCLLKMPFKDGDVWGCEIKPQDGLQQITWNAHPYGPEKVTVSAGTFQAMRVEHEVTSLGGHVYEKPEIKLTDWYAPKIGLVKRVYYDKKTMELKSFEAGKDATPAK